MRWSRLKKSINPDDIASTGIASPAKIKSPLKEQKVPKGMKHITMEMQKEKRSERKAKIRAEHKIGAVVKNEEMYEEEEEVEENSLDKTNDKVGEEQTEAQKSNTGLTIVKVEHGYRSNNMLDADQTPINNGNSLGYLEVPQPTFGLFQLSPSTPPGIFPPLTQTPALNIIPAPEIDDETENETWGNTIAVKREPESNPTATINPRLIGSPAGSSSSFSPGSSMRTSASPLTSGMKQLEGAGQKWRSTNNSRVRKTRGRSRKTVEDEDEDFEV